MGWDRGGGGVDGLRDVKTSFGVAFLKRELERFLPLLPCRPTGDREKTGHGPTDRRTGMTKKNRNMRKIPLLPLVPVRPLLPYRGASFMTTDQGGMQTRGRAGAPAPPSSTFPPDVNCLSLGLFFRGRSRQIKECSVRCGSYSSCCCCWEKVTYLPSHTLLK